MWGEGSHPACAGGFLRRAGVGDAGSPESVPATAETQSRGGFFVSFCPKKHEPKLV